MIQRLQSVFLALASLLSFGFLGTDVADTAAPVEGNALFADGSYDVFDDPILLGAFVLAGVIFLADIFLFRNRPLQSKLALAGALVAVAGTAWALFQWLTNAAAELAGPDVGIFLPIGILVFAILGRKYILADEKLVRSADRLR